MSDYYTHPSMPGTPGKAFDLSAALEDAEGKALVEAITSPENPRLLGSGRVHLQVMIDGAWKPAFDPEPAYLDLSIPTVEEIRAD